MPALSTGAAIGLLKQFGPFVVKHWKFFVGAVGGFLLCVYLHDPAPVATTTETDKTVEATGSASTEATAEETTRTTTTTETFTDAGSLSSRTTTVTETDRAERERTEVTATAKTIVKEKIVEVPAPRPREMSFGLAYVPTSGVWAVDVSHDVLRVRKLTLDVGVRFPLRQNIADGFDLEAASVRASVRMPSPF